MVGPLLLDLAVLVLGLIVVFNPLLFARLLLQVIGVILLYESISDLWAIHRISKLTRAAEQAAESDPPVIEVEVEESDDP